MQCVYMLLNHIQLMETVKQIIFTPGEPGVAIYSLLSDSAPSSDRWEVVC